MADPIIQSNGRIGVLQEFMFQNEALLDKIPGVEIERTKIGNSAGEVDDILGKGTATAIESILIAAGIPEGAKFDESAQAKLSEFLVNNGMEAEQVNTFVKDVGVVLNDKDLGPIYQRNAQANAEEILAAKTEDPASVETEKRITPNSPEVIVKEGEGEPKPKDDVGEESIKMYAGREGMHLNRDTGAPEEKGLAMSTIKPGAFVDGQGRIIEAEDVKPVITEEQYASIVEEYDIDKEHIVLAPMHKPTVVKPVEPTHKAEEIQMMASHGPTIKEHTDPLIDDKEAVVSARQLITKAAAEKTGASQEPADSMHTLVRKAAEQTIKEGEQDPLTEQGPLLSSVGPISPAFKGSAEANSTVPKDITKPGDIAVTMADIEELKAKGVLNEEETKLVAYVEQQHKARLADNPEYQDIIAKIEKYDAGMSEHREAFPKALQSLKAKAMGLDTMKDTFKKDFGDHKMEFYAKVDGGMRLFKLSLNQLVPGSKDISYVDENGKVEVVNDLEFLDRTAVMEAGHQMFALTLPHFAKEAYVDYQNSIDDYNKEAIRLVGAENTNGEATENFATHFRQLDTFRNWTGGEYYKNIEEYNKMDIAQLRGRADQMRENMDEGVHIVKRSELDAFDPNDPNKEMVAHNAPLDPALAGTQI